MTKRTITPPDTLTEQDALKRISTRLDDLFREVLKVTAMDQQVKQLRRDVDTLHADVEELKVQVATRPCPPPLDGE